MLFVPGRFASRHSVTGRFVDVPLSFNLPSIGLWLLSAKCAMATERFTFLRLHSLCLHPSNCALPFSRPPNSQFVSSYVGKSCGGISGEYTMETGDPSRLPAQLAGRWKQRHWNSVWWGKKYFVVGRLEQPMQNKNLLYRHDKPNKPTKEGPFHLYSLSPHAFTYCSFNS